MLDIEAPQSAHIHHLNRLHHLTAGDFSVILRQPRFRPLKKVATLLDALEQECLIKGANKNNIG
ncbi:hypothetical protein ABTM58_19980, partial [Acinetobacter baumannii]